MPVQIYTRKKARKGKNQKQQSVASETTATEPTFTFNSQTAQPSISPTTQKSAIRIIDGPITLPSPSELATIQIECPLSEMEPVTSLALPLSELGPVCETILRIASSPSFQVSDEIDPNSSSNDMLPNTGISVYVQNLDPAVTVKDLALVCTSDHFCCALMPVVSRVFFQMSPICCLFHC